MLQTYLRAIKLFQEIRVLRYQNSQFHLKPLISKSLRSCAVEMTNLCTNLRTSRFTKTAY